VLRSSRYIAIHSLQVIVNFHGHRDQARICRRQGVFRALTVGTKVEPDCGDAPKSSGLLNWMRSHEAQKYDIGTGKLCWCPEP